MNSTTIKKRAFESRIKGAIYIGPSVRGGFKSMSLKSRTKSVSIDRVNKLGRDQGRLIDDVELPGVDGDYNETPQIANEAATKVENENLGIDPNNTFGSNRRSANDCRDTANEHAKRTKARDTANEYATEVENENLDTDSN